MGLCLYMPGCQMVRFSDNGLKTEQKNIFYGLNCPVAHSLDHTIWKPDKKVSKKLNVHISGVQYSDS